MSDGEGLVFPCQEPRGALERACKRTELGYPLTPHDFRRTFATQCEQAGLSELMKKRLLNHVTNSVNSDVTMGYVVVQDVEMIRPRAEQVSQRMLALCTSGPAQVADEHVAKAAKLKADNSAQFPIAAAS
jgi:hypothetical protein